MLESGEIERVGGTETIKVDVRIISATNQPLDNKIQEGSFRQDLFHASMFFYNYSTFERSESRYHTYCHDHP